MFMYTVFLVIIYFFVYVFILVYFSVIVFLGLIRKVGFLLGGSVMGYKMNVPMCFSANHVNTSCYPQRC